MNAYDPLLADVILNAYERAVDRYCTAAEREADPQRRRTYVREAEHFARLAESVRRTIAA